MTRSLVIALLAACAGAPLPGQAPPKPPADAEAMATEYRAFLDGGRIPAEVIDLVRARSTGWTEVDLFAEPRKAFAPGDRLLFVNRGRTAILAVIGSQSLERRGARIVGAHIDTPSPRIDTDSLTAAGQARLRTRGYGGMRAHHWRHRPLGIVGRVAKKGGAEIAIRIGIDDDFAFMMDDGAKRGLVLMTGDTPATTKGWKPRTLLGELERRYRLEPEDLEAAELYVVPRHRAREVGVDRALIGAHGQDDRVNSYAAWRAILDLDRVPERTAMVWLVDREEIGSTGTTGARSRFFELVYAYLLRAEGGKVTEARLHRAMAASQMLSADTPAAINPNWPEVHEPQQAAILGKGPVMFPYTGRGGKRGGSAARAELIAEVVRAFAAAKVPVQYAELGRVDEGGGGTIAKYAAHRGIEVLDIGISVVSMHSPFELSSKEDIWHGYRGYRAWLRGGQK